LTDHEEKIDALREYVRLHREYQESRKAVAPFGGEMAKVIRTALKLSQRKLADSLGVTFSYISKVEKRTEPLPPDLAGKMIDMYDAGAETRTYNERCDQRGSERGERRDGMSEWISVKDRLPKQNYLIVLIAQEKAPAFVAQFRDGAFFALTDDAWDYRLRYVTHWQPLPGPPTPE
jgi:transcriptional regulator with XRE-family HTH domain